MRTLDFSPFFRSSVGFDRLFDLLDNYAEQSGGYPPYNIERSDETHYRITLAVAGFAEKELAIEVKEGVLTVTGERTGEDKATVFLQEHWPESLSEGFPLRAILVMRIGSGRETRLLPARGMDALTALAPSTMAQLPASGAEDLRFLKELVQSLPSWVLEVGSDLTQIPDTIQDLLARLER